MKLIVPDYYRDFSCLAGACRHSCCIGWEIDIDNDTLARYGALPEPLRTRVARSIQITEEGACFALEGPEERCPMLNKQGLCDLILQAGEASLCDICRDHPRFRNDFTNHTEMGLGLCCEEAARLILTKKEKNQLTVLENDDRQLPLPEAEREFFILRSQIIQLLQDRHQSMSGRMHRLYRRFRLPMGPDGPFEDQARFLLTLERLEESWADRLRVLAEPRPHKVGPSAASWLDTAFEQLAVYLVYRHLAPAADGCSLPRELSYCLFAWTLIRRLCGAWEEANGPLTPEALQEICRQYSAELEYSDENKDAILERIFPQK